MIKQIDVNLEITEHGDHITAINEETSSQIEEFHQHGEEMNRSPDTRDNVDLNKTPNNKDNVLEEPMDDLDGKLIEETIRKVLADQGYMKDSGCANVSNLPPPTSAESNGSQTPSHGEILRKHARLFEEIMKSLQLLNNKIDSKLNFEHAGKVVLVHQTTQTEQDILTATSLAPNGDLRRGKAFKIEDQTPLFIQGRDDLLSNFSKLQPPIEEDGLVFSTLTMNAGGYTYVLVDDGRNRIWAAGPETKIKVGDDVTFERGMHMNGFRSETLNRTFDRIYFVSSLRPGAADGAVPEGHPPVTSTSHNAMPDIDFSDIEVPEHGRRIADVYAHRAGLAGQTVMVRGRVVKYTGGVMGKNWIHIMDGSGDEGTNNLTVTTDVVARIGDTVLINGTLAIDKDFGFGYEYDVIVEDASVTVETAY